MDLKEYIKQLVRELLDETSATGGGEVYSTPFAFSKKGQGLNAATKYAEKLGWKLAKKPTTSKVVDYKKINELESDNRLGGSHKGHKWEIKHDDKNSWIVIDGKKHSPAKSSKFQNIEAAEKIIEKEFKMQESLLKIIKQELLNEVTYNKFKKDVKFRTKSEQLHKAIREVKKKLQEIDRIVEYTSRMKQELSEDGGINYWKATEKNVATISEMVNQLNNKIKNLNQ